MARINRQVSQVKRVPQDHAVDDPIMNVGLAHSRKRKPNYLDVTAARLLDGFGCAWNGGCCDTHDQLRVRVYLEDCLGLGECAIAVPVARPDGDQLHLGVLLTEPGFDVLDPFVLVGGAQRSGDDCEFALTPQDPRRLVGERVSNSLRRGLVDKEVARIRLRVGVPGYHANPPSPGFAQDRRYSRLVFDADRNAIDAFGYPSLDDFVLPGRVKIGRAVPNQIDAQLGCGVFSALAAAYEVGIAFGLWHHRYDGLPTSVG